MKEYMTAIHSMEEFQEAAAKGGVSVFTFSANWCPDCRFIVYAEAGRGIQRLHVLLCGPR